MNYQTIRPKSPSFKNIALQKIYNSQTEGFMLQKDYELINLLYKNCRESSCEYL